MRRRTPTIERIGPGDLTQLATDVGPVAMNVGAVLVLESGGAGLDVDGLGRELARRVARIPRLRQRLRTLPWGFGRPVWIDDEAFDPGGHITTIPCPEPGDRRALLDLAVAQVTHPLPRTRPLWRAVLVTGLAGGDVGLVIVLHHVLADGIGGLAVLASLADAPGVPAGPPGAQPRARQPAPTLPELALDNAGTRLRALARVPGSLARVRLARDELGAHRLRTAARCSLNAPTGPRRRVTCIDVPIAALRAAARGHGATVNDVLLVAVTAAMAELLAARGERVPELVVSVPISARASATTRELGNEVGVMPVAVPVTGSLPGRLTVVTGQTSAQKGMRRGASASLVGPAFRGLAAVGVFRWFVDRQRLVNTFLTNLRGPAEPLTLDGVRIGRIVPVTVTAGNVTTAFAALSYAGRLTVSVIVDPDRVPDADALAEALRRSLGDLLG